MTNPMDELHKALEVLGMEDPTIGDAVISYTPEKFVLTMIYFLCLHRMGKEKAWEFIEYCSMTADNMVKHYNANKGRTEGHPGA